MLKRIIEMFEDHTGKLSQMRVLQFVVVLCIIGTWTYTCLSTGTLVSFDLGDATTLAVPFGAKVFQKQSELGKKVT